MTTMLYWQPALPQHVVVSHDDEWYLVPLIPGGWRQRSPYRGHLTALQPMEPRASWPVLTATLGMADSTDSTEIATSIYTVSQVADILHVTDDRVRRLALSRGVGRKLDARTWVFTAADVDAMRIRIPGRPPKTAD